MRKPKLRYNEPATPDQQCCVEDCRIRGRYVYRGNNYCYGHLSKLAVDRLLELGEAVDRPHKEYVRKGRPRPPRKRGNEK